MDSPGEILRLCRLCLVKDQVNIPIFEEHGDTRENFLKISSCLPVKVSRDDKLPKKICDGCSSKLDLFYEFWNSTANAEKTLLSWLGEETVKDTTQQIAKPVETLVKEESEALDEVQSFEEATKDEAEAPPAKRARRTAAVKAQINISHDTDEDEDMDSAEPLTKIEDESDESDGEEKDPSYTEVPGTSADDQAGPSGIGKDGVEAPPPVLAWPLQLLPSKRKAQCETCGRVFNTKSQLQYHIQNLVIKISFKCIDCHLKGDDCWHSEDTRTFYHCEICDLQVIEPFHDHQCFHLHHKKLLRRSNNVKKKRNEVVVRQQCDVNLDDDAYVDENNWIDDKERCIYCNISISATLINKHESWHRKFDKSVKDLLETKPSSRIHKDVEGLCAYCGVLKPGNKLRRHEYVEHVKKYIKKVCDICGIFTCPTYIKEHMRTHDSEKGFKCEDCGKAFFRKKALARHRLVHSDEARYVCTVCGKSFKIRFNLRVHMRSHDDVKPFPCSVCKKTFTTKQWRDNHLKTHGIVGNKYKFPCEECGTTFLDKKTVDLHKRRAHLNNFQYCCDQCGRSFVCASHLNRHVKSAHAQKELRSFTCEVEGCRETFTNKGTLRCGNGSFIIGSGHWNKTYQCPLCPDTFTSSLDLLKHKLICDPSALYEQCETCNKFIKKEKMETHVKRHRIKRKRQQHSCDKCDKSFNSRQYLKLHIEAVHDAKRIHYPCDVCGKNFSTKYRAEYHKKTIHLKDFNIHCDQCGRGFLHLTELTTHVRKVHDKEVSIFTCDVEKCKRNFRSNASLQYHIQIEHSQIQVEHECLICNKKFLHVSLYRRHMTRHTDTKRFSCDLCECLYTSKNAMETHRRSHTGERPFMCEICGSSFTARKFLTVHKAIHATVRPYACKVCGKSFTQKGSLNIHEKSQHGKEG